MTRTWSDLIICPACRRLDDAGLHLQTLSANETAQLACDCGATYSIVDGVAVVGTTPIGTDAADDEVRAHLSIYLDAHWGVGGMGELLSRVAERVVHPVARAVELGCSVGRIAHALAQGAHDVIALDVHLGALRVARQLLDGNTTVFARRRLGSRYNDTTISPPPPAAGTISLLCADALDPPLPPGMFDRVVAFSLLDSVARPRGLLAVLDGLCAPGGEILLATPFTWHGSIVDDDNELGSDDPARGLGQILTSGQGLRAPYVLEDVAELPWTLRRDARSVTTYQVHYVRARKAK